VKQRRAEVLYVVINVKRETCDVVIIGAGVAGLAAAGTLMSVGQNVRCLEATSRVGGRILTVHDPLVPLAIELGAEFLHGRPSELFELIQSAGLTAFEHTGQALHLDSGRILKEKKVGQIADLILSPMAKSARRKDESFEDYLARSRQSADVKAWARVHVEGFNAAHKELISVAALTEDQQAGEEIEGDRIFRILGGYDSIPITLLRSIPDHQSVVHLNSIVERVSWRRGLVDVQYKSALDDREATLRCRHLIVTVPLGILQATAPSTGVIQFDPAPTEILKAAGALKFGQAYRVTFRFRGAFWEDDREFKRAGFLISKDPRFFVWWTTYPIVSPLLTGWTAGSAADEIGNSDPQAIAAEALGSLQRILNRKIPPPEASYFHDWHADPFFRGAYSYVPVGALAARNSLTKPVDGTLFFAGEATSINGRGGTVDGALTSGIRAANDVQASSHK
jgi:monoamine oxidase